MDKKAHDSVITAAIFLLTLITGRIYADNSPYNYTDSAILFPAAVAGGGCYRIGLCRRK